MADPITAGSLTRQVHAWAERRAREDRPLKLDYLVAIVSIVALPMVFFAEVQVATLGFRNAFPDVAGEPELAVQSDSLALSLGVALFVIHLFLRYYFPRTGPLHAAVKVVGILAMVLLLGGSALFLAGTVNETGRTGFLEISEVLGATGLTALLVAIPALSATGIHVLLEWLSTTLANIQKVLAVRASVRNARELAHEYGELCAIDRAETERIESDRRSLDGRAVSTCHTTIGSALATYEEVLLLRRTVGEVADDDKRNFGLPPEAWLLPLDYLEAVTDALRAWDRQRIATVLGVQGGTA